jgi:hypothetical protein
MTSNRTMRGVGYVLAMLTLSAAAVAQAPSIDPLAAKAAFTEAQTFSDRDGGRLWGKTLYGPLLIVDPMTHAVVANEPDAKGLLRLDHGVYVGTLTNDVAVGNTVTVWAGKSWTMLMWPLPEDVLNRHWIMGHELFNRMQQGLGIPIINAVNLHIDAPEARIWLQLEWRALAAALAGRGAAQDQAIRDALAFRAHRRQLFAGAAEQEHTLDLAEGLAEYTGLKVAMPDSNAMRWAMIGRLTNPDNSATFARTFIFTSVPSYGLLLDQRLPEWRKKIAAQTDLGGLLETTLPDTVKISADERGPHYGLAALRISETERAAKTETVKAHYRKLLVEGPTLTLSNAGSFNISFTTSNLVSLDDAGPVYPTARVTDAWGTLDVKDGSLVPLDFSGITVAAPADTKGTHLAGPGWTLDLAPGWHLVPSSKLGSYTVHKE